MKKKLSADSIFGIITILISMIAIIMTKDFPAGRSDGTPGPGYFPRIMATVVIIFSIILIVQGQRAKTEYFKFDKEAWTNLKQMLLMIGAMVVFFVLWHFVPYYIACGAYVLLMCVILHQKWKFAIPFAVILAGGVYIVFRFLLKVNLSL